jgi:hypothetical protein
MRIGEDPTLADADWQPYEAFMGWQWSGNDVYVQYRDHAGNVSEIYSALDDPFVVYTIYLPFVVQ